MIEQVIFNGVAISDYYDVINASRPIAGRTNEAKHISGADGNRLNDSYMSPATIDVTVLMPTKDRAERRERIRELSMMLHSDGLAKLAFGSDCGLYYMAVLDGEVPVKEHVRSDLVTIRFVAESPIMYGGVHSVTVPSGGVAYVNIYGTYPTEPVISGTVKGGVSNLWGIELDDMKHIRLDMGDSSTAKAVTIDCGNRSATIAGAATLPVLSSDWLSLTPRKHKLENDRGTGPCTVSWTERWV